MTNLEKAYNEKISVYSDIQEHLPTLRRYAEQCDHVTEMGVRWAVSTYALLMGHPKKMVSIDIFPLEHFGIDSQKIYDVAKEENIDYQFIVGDTRNIEIEPTDLLFIDTLHHYNQLKEELRLHADKANKYIIFHDTTTFGQFGEMLGHDGPLPHLKGLWPAIEEFLQANPQWKLFERYTNNNGLTILGKA